MVGHKYSGASSPGGNIFRIERGRYGSRRYSTRGCSCKHRGTAVGFIQFENASGAVIVK